MDIFEKKIVLASQSPRRKELLQLAGFQFDIRPVDVDETWPPNLPVPEIAGFLAEKKALAARNKITPGEILLTADSIVALNEEVFGKPRDKADAVRILQLLSGQVHQVYTGVCLWSYEKKRVFTGISNVYFNVLSPEEIDYYIETCKPYDKAGAYAIQEWIGMCKVSRIDGTFSNIMGLPMELVYSELKDF